MKKFFITIFDQLSKKFVDFMALMVAFIAVMLTVIQINNQKEYERRDREPYLQIEYFTVDNAEMKGFKFYNAGNGPAIIKDFRFYLDSTDFANRVPYKAWLPVTQSKLNFIFESINNLPEGYLVGDQEIFLLGTTARSLIKGSKDTLGFYNSETRRNLDQIVIEITYTSLHPEDGYEYELRFGPMLNPSYVRNINKIDK